MSHFESFVLSAVLLATLAACAMEIPRALDREAQFYANLKEYRMEYGYE